MKTLEGNMYTIDKLIEDFRGIGLHQGMTLLVHSSLKSFGGWIPGGPASVILALEEVLGGEGTLVMPAHSSDLSDPSHWQNPPVPEAWWEEIRRTMPAYDPSLTPTRGMGVIAECFRAQEGVLRSAHPQLSFAAWGTGAVRITEGHALAYSLGETSPLARLYEADARVLLLGVGHANNTSIHLAEYRAAYSGQTEMEQAAPVKIDGKRVWTAFRDVAIDSGDFEEIGEAFAAASGLVQEGSVAEARTLLMPQRALVDFAVKWMEANRGQAARP
ncbi:MULTISPECIES: aminoglycoside N(3)-acetyltransferase [Paenibacillus]|uniref:aminoglycoside N(3)-acetyltransferase n=1 Tax=Paenibacillus TaxID=44249 RepID=UPI0022B87754|nr:AAC(3) family N-acetyltransferase [Paenibacillus caseinilyticus]MCZ8517994.1 AAC(3) family N-acetyltransferase [Paenibacillus caseinilyticus]